MKTLNSLPDLNDELQICEEKLQKLRNLRREVGSKYQIETTWRRYLLYRIEVLSKQVNQVTVSNDTQEV